MMAARHPCRGDQAPRPRELRDPRALSGLLGKYSIRQTTSATLTCLLVHGARKMMKTTDIP